METDYAEEKKNAYGSAHKQAVGSVRPATQFHNWLNNILLGVDRICQANPGKSTGSRENS